MTFVERLARHSRKRQFFHGGGQRFVATLAAGLLLAGLITPTPPAGAATIDREKAAATILYNQIQRINNRVQVLGQRYDLAHVKLESIVHQIKNTRQIVASIQTHVKVAQSQLTKAAVFAYVTNGAVSANPLFSTDVGNVGATNLYNGLAEGNIGAAIANLANERIRLTQERSLLHQQVSAAAQQNNAAASLVRSAQGLLGTLKQDLANVKGTIANYYAEIARAAAARAAAQLSQSQAAPGNPAFVPGPNAAADVAIRTAESFIGTWYCWGGASRACVDCSGLIMLAYDAAGIYFPHYSGAMYQDTQRVPLWDIQPGDLLFYGYNGDEHVAMYVGHGQMIEAEMTGTQVHIVPIRLGWGFAGLGRPRA